MIQPLELRQQLPMKVANDTLSSTTLVWKILTASHRGDIEQVKALAAECPDLMYAQYNYTPPIHFAVREGHEELVRYLLNEGALDPTYKIYPFLDPLLTIANDRNYSTIALLLQDYLDHPERCKYTKDNGQIDYQRTDDAEAFQAAVDNLNFDKTKELLQAHPEFVLDQTFFWGEGVLMMPAKDGNLAMVELLMNHGATVPKISKWGRFYYFKHYEIAAFLIKHEMDANHHSWHNVTLLHDMAQEGDIAKAKLLLDHGADINAIDEEYSSTPLGMAARWGNAEMADYLIKQGADPNKSGADWSTPLAWAHKKGHTQIETLLKNAGAIIKFP